MNIGQVLEVHLGWAAKGIGQRIEEMLKDERTNQVQAIRDYLNDVYNGVGKQEDIDSLFDDEVIAMAQNLRDGLPLATPVFDGAVEDEIQHMLKLAYPDEIKERLGLTDSRMQVNLIDGRTVAWKHSTVQ